MQLSRRQCHQKHHVIVPTVLDAVVHWRHLGMPDWGFWQRQQQQVAASKCKSDRISESALSGTLTRLCMSA
jgi:hypothetical protein